MENFKYENSFQEEARKNRYYKLQPDKLKNRKFVYSSFPLVHKNSIEIPDLRSLVFADAYARYQVLNGNNCLFNVGINNTNNLLYDGVSNNVLSKEDPYTLLKNKSYTDLFSLDVGYDEQKQIESHSKDFIYFIQDAFLKLCKFRHIIREEDNFYLDFTSIKDKVLNEITKDNMFENLKDILEYKSGIVFDFETTTNFTIEKEVDRPELLAGINFIAIKPFLKNRHFYLESEREYIDEVTKNKKHIGVFSGNFAINPLNQQEIPIIITNYFKEEIHIGMPCVNERDLLFSSVIGLEYTDVIKNGKTLKNSLFLNDLPIKEAKNKVVDFFVGKEIGKPYESVNNTKLLLSKEFHDGISIPSYEYELVDRNTLPILIDGKNNIRTSNGVLLDKKMTSKVFNTEATQAFLSLAIRLKSEGGIVNYSSTEFILDFKEYKKIDLAIFHSIEDYLYTLVLNMVILESIKENSENIFKNFFIENNVNTKSNLIEINAINNKYGACTFRMDLLSVNLSENYLYNVEHLERHFFSIENFKEIYTYVFLNDFLELENDYKKLVEECTENLEAGNMKKYILLLKCFVEKANKYKKITSRQAKGLLILYSVISPGICEGIFKEKFNSNYPLMFESWPW